MDITRSTNSAGVTQGRAWGNYLEIFLVFLRLGLTSFGGPIAHLGYFRQECVEWVSADQATGWLHGLKIVAVAVVAQAVWSMATKLCTDRIRVSFAFVAAVIILLANNSWVQVLVIGVGALAGWKLIRTNTTPGKRFERMPNKLQSITSLALFDSFYRTGSLVFGGGHVVLPLLQAEVVPKGWEDNNTFLAGYGIAQALPGPVFSFAAI